MTTQEIPQPFVQKTERMIGRRDHIDAIVAAIADPRHRLALWFYGIGGIGKTRLLQEVEYLPHDPDRQPFRWTGIIDLYHPDFHRPDRLQRAIVDKLDPSGEHFRMYNRKYAEYETRLKEGVGRAELDRLRGEMEKAFYEEYVALSRIYRLVFTFDTTEAIQYESDLIQQVCQLESVSTQIETWITAEISRLPNTVVLFAGRPNPQVESGFRESFTRNGWVFETREIDVFSWEETLAYLEEARQNNPNLDMLDDLQIQKWIHAATGGRPIRIALLVDLLQSDQPLTEILPSTLDGDLKISPETIDRHLLDRLRKLDDPAGTLVYYLVYARRGLDAGLLHFLVGDAWTEEQIQAGLKQLKDYAFVKVRQETGQLFLHDEIYDIYDQYYRDEPSFGQAFGRIAEYYRNKLETSNLENREGIMLQLLYYELQANPYCGYYRSFARWDEDAIRGHASDFDMSLRDETVRFLNRYAGPASKYYDPRVAEQLDRAAIDREMAVRWVKRYLARGQYEKAIRTAEALRASQHPTLNWEMVEDPIYKAGLLTVWGEALAYTSAPESQTLEKLEQAIRILEEKRAWDEEQAWWRERILGRAHNNIGYVHRTRGRYSIALQHYRRALPHFTTADIPDERADTLNNLAYLLALLGRVVPAEQHVRQSLDLRQKIGRKYPIALGKNTLGLIYTLQDHPLWGEKECRDAFDIFKGLEDPRGLGLAHNGLGFAQRKQGDQWKLGVYAPEQAEKYFSDARDQFRESFKIFSKDVFEPIRLWEAYNELGSLYCDWGWFARKAKGDFKAAIELYQESIRYQNQAHQVAKEHELKFQQADSYDDLAQVYGDQCFLLYDMDEAEAARQSRRQAEDYLAEVERIVAPDFRIKPGEGFRRAPEAGEAYWLSLGKVHLWRGIWLFRDIEAGQVPGEQREQTLADATRDLIFAVAYFERYWPASYALEHTLRYFGSFLLANSVTHEWAHAQVRQFSKEYQVDLLVLETTIDDILGV